MLIFGKNVNHLFFLHQKLYSASIRTCRDGIGSKQSDFTRVCELKILNHPMKNSFRNEIFFTDILRFKFNPSTISKAVGHYEIHTDLYVFGHLITFSGLSPEGIRSQQVTPAEIHDLTNGQFGEKSPFLEFSGLFNINIIIERASFCKSSKNLVLIRLWVIRKMLLIGMIPYGHL